MIEEIKNRLKGKVAILLIGNELKGDDGAGPALARDLEGKINAAVIDCGEVPESYTGKIKELKPDTIVIVDAVDMGAKPGSISLIDKDKLNETKLFTTHNVPLKVFADYLFSEIKADIFVVGIQPKNLGLGRPISKEVSTTIDYLKKILIETLGNPSVRLP